MQHIKSTGIKQMPSFTMRTSSEGPDLVAFTTDDPEDAKNWPGWKKRLVVLQVCFMSFAA